MKTPKKFTDDEIKKASEDIIRAFKSIASLFQDISKRIERSFRIAYLEMKIAYLKAGCPYGDSDIGMYRWLTEQCKIPDKEKE